jgi:cellulose synthase operon protein C
VALAPSVASADLRSGEDKFLHGDYAGALQDFKAVKGKDAAKAGIRAGYVSLRTGDYAAAEAAGRAGQKTKAVAADASVLLAEALRAAGKYAEAKKLVDDVAKDAKQLRARALSGLIAEETGQHDAALVVWNGFYDDWDAGTIKDDDAVGMMYVAMAARGLDDYHGANEMFGEAVRVFAEQAEKQKKELDPRILEANAAWGWIFLEKYNAGEAEVSFDEVLKIDPHHPDANAGMARVKLEQSYDVKGAMKHINEALAQNAKHPEALLIRAEIEIDNAEYDNAKKTLAEVLAANPNEVEAHALLATIHWLRDDLKSYEAVKKQVFAINPRFARFYHIVSDFAVKEHRYREAIALEEEAIKVDSRYYVALAAIGSGYLRMGEEEKGLKALNEAFELDKFNVRTYNILNLFEDSIPKDYVVFNSGKNFKFRMVKEEKAALERYIPRSLDKAFADMVKRYGFTPQQPVTIELFADPDQYSVRTVGLPNLGALGVCFGQVITALSPSGGNINWGMVLWHELGHVFAIQLSNSRVPRWFTEGLSEYETLIARPEWRRENDADVWVALSTNTLPSVLDLNSRFLRARDMNEMVVAYHMSSVTVEYIAKKWGFPKIVEALKLYGKGKDTAEVIKTITGQDIPTFDTEFRKYLTQRLTAYQGTFKLSPAGYDDLASWEKEAAAKPADAEALADVAIAYLVAEELDKAVDAADKALAIDAKNKKALWVSAELLLAKGDIAGAKGKLDALIAAGGDGYDARMRLGRIAIHEDNLNDAIAALTKAKALDPERSEPYYALAELYLKKNREDDAIKELEKYVYIEQMEYAPLKKLIGLQQSRKNWAKVREFGEMALYINPYDVDLHADLGNAYIALGKGDDAVFEFESALASDPPMRRPAVGHIGVAWAYVVKKDVKKAKAAVDKALKLEPKNAEALAMKTELAAGRLPPLNVAAPKPAAGGKPAVGGKPAAGVKPAAVKPKKPVQLPPR